MKYLKIILLLATISLSAQNVELRWAEKIKLKVMFLSLAEKVEGIILFTRIMMII